MPVRSGTVTVRDLGHRFPEGRWLFRRLSLTLERGRVYALTGPSGSGKSTLLSILAGWVKPVEGEVDRTSVRKAGWVFQNPHGMPRRTARDHVALPLLAQGLHPVEADARAQEMLERVGLASSAARPFRALSGGEAQRLMIARGIVANPDLFLVDEPTAQLDPSSAAEVNGALAAVAQSHAIVIVATHDERTRDACTDHIDLRRFQTAEAGPL